MAVTKSTTKPAETAKEVKAREDELKQEANVPAVTSASDFSPSGAPRQPGEFDPNHPAIDNNPRAGTTVGQNKIDMNDPTLTMEEAVAKELKEHGSGAVAGDDDKKAGTSSKE